MIKAFRRLRSDRQAPYHLWQYDDPTKQTDERTKRKMISIHTCCVLYMHAPYYLGMAWYGIILGMCCAAHHHPLTHHPVPTLPATYLLLPAILAVRTVLLMEMIVMIVPCTVIPVFLLLSQRCAAAGLEPADYYPLMRGALVYSFSFPNTARSLFIFMPCLSACQFANLPAHK